MKHARWVAFFLMLFSAGSVHAGQGPLQLKNRFPLHQLFLTPKPLPSQTPAQGNLQTCLAVDYSPIYFSHTNTDWRFLIDLEMTTVDLSLIYGLTPRLALSADLPFISFNAGFLDRFLEGYHDAIGVANYDREERADNTFAYRVICKGRPWINARSGTFEPADSTLSVQWLALPKGSGQAWDGSLILSLKIPSGDADHAMGSGQFDYGLFATAERRVASWSFSLMTGVAINHDPGTLGARIKAQPSYSLFGGIGYHYSGRTIWLAQINSYTSPIQATGISEVDTAAVELALGLHYQADKHWMIEFAFGEDLTRAAPDFTLRLGMVWTFQTKGK